jgi:tetraacyldisaccharide 4'-kinase
MTKARHKVFDDFKKRVEGVIAGDTSHRFDPLASLLHGVSWLYKCLMVTRNRLYDRQVLPSQRLPCAVVSVGNMAVGGTGKTPMTVCLVKQIQKLGYRPAILSRGYKGRYEKKGAVVSDGRSILCDARQAGDEPYLMANLLPTVPVIVGSDRTKAGRMALDRFAPDVLVLDDAFQHRRLHRDLDILLLDGRAPFGNSFVLPRGPMREPVQALQRCHAIVLTRCPSQSSDIYRNVAGMVRPRPVFRTHHRTLVRGILPADHCPDQRNLNKSLGEPSPQLTDRRVYAFCGLARNQAFLDTVQQMCKEVAGQMGFEDHHPYRPADMQRITAGARACNSECLVTTDKDFVRLPQTMRLPLPLLVLGIRIEFGDDANAFHRFMEQQLERIHSRVL